jgi:hypothetical protein
VTRSISLPIHSALELLGGIALLAGPFLLGAGPAGLVLVTVGALQLLLVTLTRWARA